MRSYVSCPQCARLVPAEQSRCHLCGSTLVPPDPAETPALRSATKLAVLLLAVGLFAPVLIEVFDLTGLAKVVIVWCAIGGIGFTVVVRTWRFLHERKLRLLGERRALDELGPRRPAPPTPRDG